MRISYQSTRGGEQGVTASQAILKGLACDGGLFMPTELPKLDLTMKELAGKTYQETAYEVMKLFLTDFTEEELKYCIEKAYDSKFDTETIAPLVKADGAYYLELFHGSTIAFKDMALSILPYFMTTAAKKNHADKEIVILTATSGDTGKAAMTGFADVPGTRIIVFYPKDGVSRVQELQMVTQKGDNTSVVAIHGNFDDAQAGVKRIFSDEAVRAELDKRGYFLSSANSINWGRILPQVVYYISAYCDLVRDGALAMGDKVNFCVPTGNFGDILAAYYAKRMGLPVNRLICASNSNNVLTDFLRTGIYDRNRPFHTTISPSMDILISSNLERLLYLLTGEDDAQIREWFTALAEQGTYEVTDAVKAKLTEQFYGGFCDDAETKATIAELYKKYGYTCDTHTAVAVKVYEDYRKETGDTTKTLIASTASPFKFSASVLDALGKKPADDVDEYDMVELLHEASKMEIPQSLAALKTKPRRFEGSIDKSEMQQFVLQELHLS